MPELDFRFRCPKGDHSGLVPGKLFCTACGRMRSETDEQYERHLDAKILSLGGGTLANADRYVAYKESYVRVLHGVANDFDPDDEDDEFPD